MKAIFNRVELAKALAAVCRIVPSRVVKPILECALISADGMIEATDMKSVSLKIQVPSQLAESGKSAIPAKQLRAFLDASTGDDVHIEDDLQNCFVRTTNAESQPAVQDPGAYPTFTDDKAKHLFTIQSDVFLHGVKLTRSMIADESARYALTGYCLDLTADPTIVTTDGKAMSVFPMGCASKPTKLPCVVPTKAIDAVCALAGDEITVSQVDMNNLVFTTGNAVIKARLVEGRFPAWREVFPKKFASSVPLNVGATAHAVKLAALSCDDNSKAVKLSFANGECSITANSDSRGRAAVTMPVAECDGFSVMFDHIYLLEMLARLPADSELRLDYNQVASVFTHDAGRFVIVPLTKGE